MKNSMAELLTHLFDVWNGVEIEYLVLRNYEELPTFTGNDIDILLNPAQAKLAEKLLQQTAREKGWEIHNIVDFACRAIYLFNKDTLEQVHIDFMCGMKWHFLMFAHHDLMLKRRRRIKNFYIPNLAHEAAINLMTRLIYGGYVKEKYRSKICKSAVNDRKTLTEVLSPWIGINLAEKLIDWAAQNQWQKIENSVSMVRKNVWIANLQNPLRLVIAFVRDAFRFMQRLYWSPGVSLVFFGPDGCGKTSVADGSKLKLAKTFSSEKGLHCHWKPIRPTGESIPPTKDPHGNPPRNFVLSLTYFIYHYLPFIWGWWRYVKPVLFKNGLIIIDRYYYDFLVDQRRYRLNLPQWIVKLGFGFVKKPDLIFCLDADPEILQARKKEVSFEECKRQREAYRILAKKLPNGYVIDASKPLEKVVQDVQCVILEYMAERIKKRVYGR